MFWDYFCAGKNKKDKVVVLTEKLAPHVVKRVYL